jgi:hypothetical protein
MGRGVTEVSGERCLDRRSPAAKQSESIAARAPNEAEATAIFGVRTTSRDLLAEAVRGHAHWGDAFMIDHKLEHAVEHPMRHRIQLERIITSGAVRAPRCDAGGPAPTP